MKRFYLPIEIETGEGCFAELGNQAARYGQRAMLVCGANSLRASGRLTQALKLLEAAGLTTNVYDAIAEEPTLDLVQTGLDQARANDVQVLIGIGGGSAMDAAKAIAGLYTHPGTVYEYHRGELALSGGGLPWIAVPTTAGTGAEVTKNAVLLDAENQIKFSLRHDGWFASVALIDPEMTTNLPPDVTAASGSDALTQAIESYTSIGASPVTDGLAVEAIMRIARSLKTAVQEGSNLAARADMLYGSMLAGCAMANARLGGVHGMAHPLGARYHLPHGLICGLLLPYTMAYNVAYTEDKYAHIARLLGVDTRGMELQTAAKEAISRVSELLIEVGIPQRLKPLGVRRQDFPLIVEGSLPSGSLKHNPRPLSAEDVETILIAAF
jgi:alcohol dehydrogenase class IV